MADHLGKGPGEGHVHLNDNTEDMGKWCCMPVMCEGDDQDDKEGEDKGGGNRVRGEQTARRAAVQRRRLNTARGPRERAIPMLARTACWP